jgi:hypothetical protein
MTKKLFSGRCAPDDTVADADVIYKTFHKFSMSASLADLARALDHDPFVLIVTEQRCFSANHSPTPGSENGSTVGHQPGSRSPNGSSRSSAVTARLVTRSVVSGIVSRIDLLDYISSGEDPDSA